MLGAISEDRVFYRVAAADDDVLTGYDDLPARPQRRPRTRSVFDTLPYRDAAVRVAVRHAAGRQRRRPVP